jgi:hypothetical protein
MALSGVEEDLSMAYVNEKPTAHVVDGERASIEYTDEKGKKHTYSHARNVWLRVSQLQERVFTEPPDEAHPEPRVERSISGIADLDRDRSISVAGAPNTTTSALPISFRLGQWKRPEQPGDGVEMFRIGGGVGRGHIGFISADWEIGNEDAWYVECHVNEAVLKGLLDATASGRVTAATVVLQYVRGLYQDEGDYAPPSARRHLFLRPGKSDNRTDLPESAEGDVTTIGLVLAAPSLALQTPRRPTEDTAIEEERPEPTEAPAQAIAIEGMPAYVHEVIASLEKVRGTLRWLVGAALLVALALFGHK